MKEIEAITWHLGRYRAVLTQQIDRLYNALEELQRTTLLLLAQDRHTDTDIDQWLQQDSFAIDEDGFHQSLPLLKSYRAGEASKDAISFSWGQHLQHDHRARRHLFLHRNIGSHLKHIHDRLGDVGWIYYQDAGNIALQYPYIDQCTAIPSDFDWSSYHTFVSVSPANNAEREIRWTPPTIDYAGEGLILSVSIPVWNEDEFIGLWSIDLPIRYLIRDFESSISFTEQQQFIVNQEKMLVLHEKLNFEIDQTKGQVFLHSLAELGGDWESLNISEIITKDEGTAEITDVNGVEWVYCYSHVSGVEWTLFCGLPKASLEEAAAQRLSKAFRQIAQGNFDHQIESSPTYALPTLVDEFNKMSMRLNTEQKRRQEMEVQLRQAQKMEAVGRLAGGLAHDFNNITGVIMGYAELALEELNQNNPLYFDLKEIKDATNRSIELTRQLLAFARKQTIAPEVLDVNLAIKNILKIIQRLIGEDIQLIWQPGDEIWQIKIDPSQLDQILTNLCINARDAINGVGKLIIETSNITLDKNFCAGREGCTVGDFVQLTVTDNGVGMDKQTLEKIFEPFFSTKQVGKGTGLGLATIYGIIKQNNGYIEVSSEPQVGTKFTLYFPRITEESFKLSPELDGYIQKGNNELLLVVEDDISILGLTKRMLKQLNYKVIAVNSPQEAITLVGQQKPKIDLLISDVIMPELNGRDLAKKLQSFIPDLKVLYISGYPSTIVAQRGILDKDVVLLDKPFTQDELAVKVSQLLTKKTPGMENERAANMHFSK